MDDSNFFSMDKLVEFGMGVAVAKQMVESMNSSLDSMAVPGAGKIQNINDERVYYVVVEGQTEGPYNMTEMTRLINSKKVHKETYVWKPGMKDWNLVENVEELLRLIALTPPPIPK